MPGSPLFSLPGFGWPGPRLPAVLSRGAAAASAPTAANGHGALTLSALPCQHNLLLGPLRSYLCRAPLPTSCPPACCHAVALLASSSSNVSLCGDGFSPPSPVKCLLHSPLPPRGAAVASLPFHSCESIKSSDPAVTARVWHAGLALGAGVTWEAVWGPLLVALWSPWC